MPDERIWLERVPEILAQLDSPALPPFLDRPSIEKLFAVSSRQAVRLMQRFGGYQVGRSYLVSRRELLRVLRRIRVSGKVERAQRRKERLLEHLASAREEFRARKLVIPAPPDTQEATDLPAGVQIEKGQLTVTFNTPEELLERLFALSRLLAGDWERYRKVLS